MTLPALGGQDGRPRRFSISDRVLISLLVLLAAVAVLAPWLPLQDPDAQDILHTLSGPSGSHLLGTDDVGRDVLARLIAGLNTSLGAAAVATLVASVLGVTAGLIGGYLGGWVDVVLSRISEVLLSVPALVLLLAVQSALHAGIHVTMAVLGALLTPQVYRVIRGSTIAIAKSTYVSAGRMSGCSHGRVITRYILPNIREQVAVQVSFQFGYALLVEAGISLIGIGVQPPAASLGTLLATAGTYMEMHPLLVLAPGVVLTILILAFNTLGDRMAENGSTR